MLPFTSLAEYKQNIKEIKDNLPFINALQPLYRGHAKDNYDLLPTVSGLIKFTIEPRCTMEKIPFRLSYLVGELKIEKIKN